MAIPILRGRRRRNREPLRVGKPDVKVTASAHIPGTRQGNEPGSYERMEGHHPDDTSSSRRSTGIAPEKANPILPGMPNLSPP